MSDPILRRSTKEALLHLSVPTSQLWVRPAVTRETLWRAVRTSPRSRRGYGWASRARE
jgi:hypothetical protein